MVPKLNKKNGWVGMHALGIIDDKNWNVGFLVKKL
jgi:hypothetical protein